MSSKVITSFLLILAVGCTNQKDHKKVLAPAEKPVPAATLVSSDLSLVSSGDKSIATSSDSTKTLPVLNVASSTDSSKATIVASGDVSATAKKVEVKPVVQDPVAVKPEVKQPAPIVVKTLPKKSSATQTSQSANDPLNTKQAAIDTKKKLDQMAKDAEGQKDERSQEEKDKWQKLVDYVAEKGDSQESISGFYVSLTDSTSEDRLSTHVSNFLSVVGGPDGKGGFAFTRVEAVWENWVVTKDDQLDGDQWMFLLSRDGKIAKQFHYHFLKDKQDHILVHQGVDSATEEAAKKWDEMRNSWYKKIEVVVKP